MDRGRELRKDLFGVELAPLRRSSLTQCGKSRGCVAFQELGPIHELRCIEKLRIVQ
jgi:hypothetical protein